MVDLAGSEGASAGHDQTRAIESKNINTSLLALSKVIQELSEKASVKNSNRFISYRESKLTRILQNALSGNSKTCVICTINQVAESRLESISTLKFGVKAKVIKNKFSINTLTNKNSVDYEYVKKLEERIVEHEEKIRLLEEEKTRQEGNIDDTPKSMPEGEDPFCHIYTKEQLNYTQKKLQQNVSLVNQYQKTLVDLSQEKSKMQEKLKEFEEYTNQLKEEIAVKDREIKDFHNGSVRRDDVPLLSIDGYDNT